MFLKMANLSLVILASFILSACSPRIMNLLSLSEDRSSMEKSVTQQEDDFNRLLADINKGIIKSGIRQEVILQNYHEPILITKLKDNTQIWLYREPLAFFNTERINLYFDSKGQLLNWQLVEE